MKRISVIISIGWLIVATSCSSDYKRIEQGVVVPVSANGTTIPLQVQFISEDIIKIANGENTDSSLIISDYQKSVPVDIQKSGDTLVLNSPKLLVKIALANGQVLVYNLQGELLLNQLAFDASEDSASSVIHFAKHANDERLFGLGQHQKGSIEVTDDYLDLFQSNMEAVSPFVLSNKGYALLFDDYSQAQFGNLKRVPVNIDAHFIDSNKTWNVDFYSLNGGDKSKPLNKNELLTTDYKTSIGINPADYKLLSSRKDSLINYWLHEKATLTDSRFSNFIKIWDNTNGKDFVMIATATIIAPATGEYLISNYSSDWFNIFVDGKKITETLSPERPTISYSRVTLEAGKKYKFRIEWIQKSSSNAVATIQWSVPEPSSKFSFRSDNNSPRPYYFIYGATPDSIILNYRKLTGVAPMNPKWSYGLFQSKNRYKTASELEDIATKYRELQLPLDAVVLDYYYWKPDTWGTHEFDTDFFPDMQKTLQKLHDNNIHLMISAWGRYKEGIENTKELADKHLLSNFACNRGFYFINPHLKEARDIYWKQLNKTLFASGVDAWWLDGSEPQMQPLPITSAMAFPDGDKYLNTYSLMLSKATYEGQRNADANKRVFILTRSGFAGQQKYAAATWSGDISANWKHYNDQISAGLGYAVSGLPYWCADIGAYFVKYPDALNNSEYLELYTRWFQFGAFCPLFRIHGESIAREPWLFTGIYRTSQEKYIKLRYELMPYIYSLGFAVRHDGYTIMRPLLMDFGADNTALSIQNQFMFGPAIMACPVTEKGATSRKVYLPKGCGWYDYYTNEYFDGGQTIVANAPLETIPLYVKAGSIIPTHKKLQYATDNYDTTFVKIYPGADGTFALYDDEGNNYNYEKDAYRLISIQYNQATEAISITKQAGNGFDGMKKEQVFSCTIIGKETNNIIIDYKE